MRRLLVFVLLGPVLGYITGKYGLLTLIGGEMPSFDWHEIILLPVTYFMGIVPALLAYALDKALADRGVRWRPLWVTLAGFVVSFMPAAGAILFMQLTSPLLLLWGLIGAVPALICSCLSGPGKPVIKGTLPSPENAQRGPV